jgi:hypothetical protein
MARHNAMPRCCLERGQAPKQAKSRYDKAPVHKDAVGVYAPISAASTDRLVGVTRFLLPEIIASHGLEYETARLTEGFKPKDSPRVTIVPVAETGKEMTRQARKESKEGFRNLQKEMLLRLGRFAGINSRIKISGFDWYGDYNNVLVARLDESSKEYTRLLEVQGEAQEVLSSVGLRSEYLYGPDHISLLKQGTRANPLESDEEHKESTIRLFHERLTGETVAFSGLSLITAANKEFPIKSPFRSGLSFSNEIG